MTPIRKFVDPVKRDGALGFLMAAGLHLSVLFFSGFAVQPVQYGIEQQSGGIEISLTAALPSQEQEQEVPEQKAVQLASAEESDMRLSDLIQPEKSKKEDAVSGDGSSPEPGKDATTFYSQAGAVTPVRVSHFRNHPPKYPKQAVELGQEGLVLLHVQVGENGHSGGVEIKESSGFPLLDEAAIRAVSDWKFDPAKIGLIAVRGDVDIPIRFSIEDYQKSLR